MGPAMIERLVEIAAEVRNAPHGCKSVIYEQASKAIGMSQQTLRRKLSQVTMPAQRKRRSDARSTALTFEEAKLISALLIETTRKNGKRLLSIPDALEMLRANGVVLAERLNKATGEVTQLSASAIHRGLRLHRLHPDQLSAPAPVTALASPHPNHCWQVDASLCTLYYLSNGLQGMDAAVYYKNKPGNMERISQNRVWRYVVTDHCTGWIYVEYVLGAESAQNLCSILINAMQCRATNGDIMHGVPKFLMMDPGSANTAGNTRNLLRSLNIQMIVNEVGNARAKGQVENANNLVETKFEPGLKLQRIDSLEHLNQLAAAWRAKFNSTAIHARLNSSRSSAWMRIRQDQLTLAPSVEDCRALVVSEPESRLINSRLCVSFRGHEFDVSSVPGVMVGEKLMIARNAWSDDVAQVLLHNEEGREIYHLIPKVVTGDYGFAETAAIIGETYKRHADTVAQKNLQLVEQVATGTTNQADAEAARKAKKLPFGGRIDPYKHISDAEIPKFMPRRGTELDVRGPVIETPPLGHFAAAKRIKPVIGDAWTADSYAWIESNYPNGIPEDDIDTVAARLVQLRTGHQTTGLRLIGEA